MWWVNIHDEVAIIMFDHGWEWWNIYQLMVDNMVDSG